jgi:hypothetical protein
MTEIFKSIEIEVINFSEKKIIEKEFNIRLLKIMQDNNLNLSHLSEIISEIKKAKESFESFEMSFETFVEILVEEDNNYSLFINKLASFEYLPYTFVEFISILVENSKHKQLKVFELGEVNKLYTFLMKNQHNGCSNKTSEKYIRNIDLIFPKGIL